MRQWQLYMIRDSKLLLDLLVLWMLELGMRRDFLSSFLSFFLSLLLSHTQDIKIERKCDSYVDGTRRYRKNFIGQETEKETAPQNQH